VRVKSEVPCGCGGVSGKAEVRRQQ
jgi:hypothetical protein